jgi:L-iditol 2-dehydrogenase
VKTDMMAAVLYGRESLRVEPVAVPPIGPGDLLVRVRVALTCGTDVKVFRRGYHARMIVPPAVFGHELAGDVVAAGSDVRGFSVGDRVMAANSAPCGKCNYCMRNRPNLCDDLLFNNGAYAEFIRIPSRIVEKNTYEIPAHVSYRDAALAEPLACVLKGLEDTAARPGDTVVIIGLGPIGSMFVRMAKVAGAKVIAVGRRRVQTDRALALGADEVVITHNTPNAVEAVRALTGGHGAEVVIEAVGKPETWHWAVNMLAKGGTVNFFGGCPADTKVLLDTNLLHYSEISCKASFHHTPELMQKALDHITARDITASSFVNREEPLIRLPEVMQHLMSHNGHLKTAILP